MITCEYLEQSLAGHVPEQLDVHLHAGTHAAVALIVREALSGLQLAFYRTGGE